MSTERQRQAARENGAKSHGPVTPEGKACSSRNALRHGLCAKEVVVRIDEADDFNTYRQECYDELQPQTRIECDLVDDIVAARWRLHRIRLAQTALLDLELSRQEASLAGESRLALAFKKLIDNSHALEVLNRYETRYERTIHRALALLLSLRKQKIAERTQSPVTPIDSTSKDPDAPPAPAPPSSDSLSVCPDPASLDYLHRPVVK